MRNLLNAQATAPGSSRFREPLLQISKVDTPRAPQSGDCHQFPPLELAGCTRFAPRDMLLHAVPKCAILSPTEVDPLPSFLYRQWLADSLLKKRIDEKFL